MAHGEFVRSLYLNVLRRAPSDREIIYWTNRCSESSDGLADIVTAFHSSKEYKSKILGTKTRHVPGHFYSPVVNADELSRDDFQRRFDAGLDSISGVDLSMENLKETWFDLLPYINEYPFPEHKIEGLRYHWHNGVYGLGDSSVLFAMLNLMKPKRIIEIGSGFSSACMLDSVDHWGLDTSFTFIDPNPQRVHSLLYKSDYNRCTVFPHKVQNSDISIYKTLRKNDILFIDSSHVAKAGSDVNFEIFEILPQLEDGVIVHIHDIFFPFEYPIGWIFHRRMSWNENYLIRAFLMYNDKFKIKFFNHAFARKNLEIESSGLRQDMLPIYLKNPGGGLWLVKG